MLDLSGYEIRGLLGAGGMGEVHRAYDKRLGREVAIKRLPQAFTSDPDRLARFEREARVLASLNHPNIAAIYGIEGTSSDHEHRSCALILELVEGPTLADKIDSGPLKIAEATDVAIQIARALEAAHESGIVHRDLKPANIKITPQGTVKVLDFGLATPVKDAATSHSEVTTVTLQQTQPGAVMGTPRYMSPEQARGLPVDRRTDVWAFGCVLFEMLTGKPAFSGATTTDIVAKVLERDPDWASLPEMPDAMHRVLRWSLMKDAHRRLRHVGDAILELEATASRHDTPPARRRWPIVVGLVGAAIIGAIVGALGGRWLQPSSTNATRSTSRFAVPVAPLEVIAQNVAISPDGRYIAYLAGPPDHQKTYLRHVDDRASRVISEVPMQAPQPFFSPDSQWVAFFDANKLKKMPVGGGSSITLAEAPTPRGGTWISDGSIVFVPVSRGGLMWIPANGGTPQALSSPDENRGETSHRQPVFLPPRTVLFVAESSGAAGRSLQAISLDTKAIRVVSTGDGLLPSYVPTGHLAQVIDGRLVITPFDASALRFTGPAVTVLEDVNSFSFSNEGTLVYSEAPAYNTRVSTVVWTSRDGVTNALPLPPAVYDHPRLSPDGRKIVIHRADARAVSGSGLPASGGLWIYDVARETLSKLTYGTADDWAVWNDDGTRIIYASNRPRTLWDMLVTPIDGSAPAQELLPRPLIQIPRAASPNGDEIVYQEQYADRPSALWRLPLRGTGEPRPLFGVGAGEMMPTFSPDSRWIGYVSKQSGRDEVYVRSSTGEGSIWTISNGGGVEPVWSADGRELFYRADDKMMAVDVVLSPTISFGKPHALFEGSYMFGATESQGFDVSRDGRRFLMLKPERRFEAMPLSVIVNWFDDLRRRVPPSP
jgi:serine/threonine protein kinase